MALTKIDFSLFRGSAASLESSAYIVLNPTAQPGCLVLGCASAVRDSLGSQVACKLALEHFVEGVLAYFSTERDGAAGSPVPISASVLEQAFDRANKSVFDFGHKMAAAGRVAASLFGLVIQDSVIAAARVGAGSAYLVRGGASFPFFEDLAADAAQPNQPPNSLAAKSGHLIGSHSVVEVEVASVPVQEHDTILIFSERLNRDQQELLRQRVLLSDTNSADKRGMQCIIEQGSIRGNIKDLADCIFSDCSALPFAAVASIGPQAIYLERRV